MEGEGGEVLLYCPEEETRCLQNGWKKNKTKKSDVDLTGLLFLDKILLNKTTKTTSCTISNNFCIFTDFF